MFELKGKHIFIVEDNTNNRVVFQMALIVAGARVSFERWGKESVPMLQRLRGVDLVVLDLMLGGKVSGLDIFREIRLLPEFDTVPIVAISAADASTTIPKVRQLGFNGFISKPVDEYLLPQQLARIMNGETIWDDGTLRV